MTPSNTSLANFATLGCALARIFQKRTAILVWTFFAVLFLSLGAGLESARADSLDTWQWRNPLPEGNTLSYVTFGDNTFVVIGADGALLTSTDGVIWSSNNDAPTTDFTSLGYYNNDLFLGTADNGTILTSTDGLTWVTQDSGISRDLFGAAYGDGSYVTVGAYGTILTSPDGVNWSGRNSPTGYDLNGVACGSGTFVAVGDDGTVLTSTDAATWTLGSADGSNDLTYVAYGGGIFLAVDASGNVLISTNGVNWTAGAGVGANTLNLTYENGLFVVITSGNGVETSANGAAWATVSPGAVSGVAFGNGTYVAVGTETDSASGNQYGGIWTSPNAATWTARNSAITYENIEAMAYGNDTFVMVGQKGTILSSLDGQYMTLRTGTNAENLNSVVVGDGTCVAVGNDVILTSSDEVTWAQTFAPTDGPNYTGVTYASGTFVAVGTYESTPPNPATAVSTDGKNWSGQIILNTGGLNGVAYGNNTFVGVGYNNTTPQIYTSPDGANWTRNTSPNLAALSATLTSVAYSKGVFVAVGTNGTLLTSTNGQAWVSGSSGTTSNLNGVTVGNGIFVADGNDGALISSTNGTTWTPRDTGIANPPQLNGIGYGWGTFVAVGNSGTILQSAALEGVGPVVTTGTASNITYDSAVVTGTVSSNGPASVANFEYATNPQFVGAAYTANTAVASGSTPIPVTATLQNLSPSQTYYFRAQAYNVDALQSGTTVSFTTPAAPPGITSSNSVIGYEGSPFSYQITATNAPYAFNALGLPTGLTVNTSTGLISGTVNTTGTFATTIYATNSATTSSTSLTITILLPAAPVITSATNVTAENGVPFSYQIAATNGPSSYNATNLPTGLGVNTSTGLISGTPVGTGSFSAVISAVSTGGTGAAFLSISVVNPPIPVISSGLSAAGVEGTAFSYQIAASNSPFSFGVTGALDGLSLNSSTGLISGTPTTTGTFNPTISATNDGGTGYGTLTLVIAQSPPVVTSSLAVTGTEGAAFGYQITANYSPTSYSASGLPTGLSINAHSGYILGVPTESGTFNVGLDVSNGAGTTPASLTLVVVLPPAPVISSAAGATGTDGVSFSYQIAASNNPTSFGASGLPTGLTYNPSSGVISGKPTESGTFAATISAVNVGGTGSSLFTLVILQTPPAISSGLIATGTTGAPFSYQITASNSPSGFGATGLPTGLTVDPTSGLISGTPTVGGTYAVVVSAANLGGTGSATLALTLDVNFPTVKGSYVGLASVGGTNSGLFTITVAANGHFTGKLTLAAGSYPLSGAFSHYGTYTGTVNVASGALDDTLAIQPSTPAVSGSIVAYTGGNIFNYTVASSLLWTTKSGSLPTGIAGTYTALLPSVTGTDDPTVPSAPGYSTIKVSTAGAVTVTGKLGDGTVLKATSHLNADGRTWTLFSLLYPAKHHGTIAGTMTFESLVDSDCDGVAAWIKPVQTTGSYYPAGFATAINVVAAKYTAPPLASGTASISLTGGNLTDPGITDNLSISSNDKATVSGANTGSVTLSLTSATGAFSGQFLDPVTSKKTPFGGVIYQKPTPAGFGLFLGTDQSGSVDITR